MPYVRKGNTVYKKEGKKLVKVGTSTPDKIQSYMNLLRAREHGWEPTGKPARSKRKTKGKTARPRAKKKAATKKRRKSRGKKR